MSNQGEIIELITKKKATLEQVLSLGAAVLSMDKEVVELYVFLITEISNITVF